MRERIAAEIPHMRRFARGLARDPVMADDLVQDCLERALSREHLYDPARSLRTWLFTILRNIFLNDQRTRSARANVAQDYEAVGLPHAAIEPQHHSVYIQQVLNAVAALPAEQREVILLVAVEGLSYQETASIVGTPIGTVMSRLARAREELRGPMTGGPRSHIRRLK
jgi:RNA polymerase sigma-70 factor (ECF subfamily)